LGPLFLFEILPKFWAFLIEPFRLFSLNYADRFEWEKAMESWLRILENALNEDIGDGDVTTLCTVPKEQKASANLWAKAPGVLAGAEVFSAAFRLLDKNITVEWLVADGETVRAGQKLALVSGPTRAILSAERVALNFLQRMSGIATLTRQMVEAVKGSKARILDTRKTAPGLRYFDKWAVRIGGGENHRFGLYDMVLIKENHIEAAGGIRAAVQKVRACLPRPLPVEVEVKNLDELRQALELNVDRILLDNMDVPTLKKAVEITRGRIPLEASGNVTLQTVGAIARTGVDFISVGSLTHSVQALDVSLIIETS
jgi:nicotinate-nucleotide pyrophosphorylase (carboxylating)